MEIRQYEDGSIELFGYVNISERNSKILSENGIRFKEQIKKGAWSNAIERNKDIKLLLNHSWDKIYGSTSDNLRLFEDNIGARFSIRTSDETLKECALNNDFTGLSFAFKCNKDVMEDTKDIVKLRYIEDMDVSEVSLLTVEPAYDGCLVEMRDKDGDSIEVRYYKTELELEQENYQEVETKEQELTERIRLMKLELEI